ncbi:MAG: biotin carboxyl carrier protein [Novosphingobium sp.]
MAAIRLVETSLRDGNQSLWAALGVDTARTLTVAPLIEAAGFKAIDFTTSTHMGVAVRYKQEDPWQRIRLMAAACPNTPLQFLSTGFRFISWETATPEFMALAYKTLVTNGMLRFALADPMNDVAGNLAGAKMAKDGGADYVIGALVFTVSPIHDDAHYAERARALAASPHVDALYIKDPGGLLTAQRAATLIPAIQAVIGDKPLELHAHCTIGQADQSYLEGAALGVEALQCASGAASDGTSNPPIERVIANLKALGHTIDVDEDAVGRICRYFDALAEAEDLPKGAPAAFDAAYYQHQLPGGMVGTMRRHLGEQRLTHLEGQVIEEIGRVREELGWPIVMTPFAQMVLTQAVMNVTGAERYAVIPDEVMRYALGKFGRPNVPIADHVMDRIMSSPRARELEAETGMADLAKLRARFGGRLSDEEFLLRATMPADQVDAMREVADLGYDPRKSGAMNLLRDLLRRSDVETVSIARAGFRLELS